MYLCQVMSCIYVILIKRILQFNNSICVNHTQTKPKHISSILVSAVRISIGMIGLEDTS